MKFPRWLGLAPLALCMLLTAGCGRAPLTPVQGKVAYKGFNLHGGVIVFTPDGTRGERGSIAVAKIREDGSYMLLTGDAPGASPGWYRVTVSAVANSSLAQPGGAGFTYPQSLLPEKYRDPETSLLTCEVKSGRTNNIDFNLD
jgi:hypothetical protein